MLRRKFINKCVITAGALGLGGVIGWYHFFDGPVSNPCLIDALPKSLAEHELMSAAFEGLDPAQLWDCHFHLVGNGLDLAIDGKPSGIWLNPMMSSWLSPQQRLLYGFYLNAACIKAPETADLEFIQTVNQLLKAAPEGVKLMLLAFDYQYDSKGKIDRASSIFHIPNEYASRLANRYESFEWIASVHPYREDALAQLQWCAENGARAVKWLPPAMNIDPSSKQCDEFYAKLKALDLPLLSHAGEEKAVRSDKLQHLANPLLLRRPLDQGVTVIIAHCASLGQSRDLEAPGQPLKPNFELFTRLMNDEQYRPNLLADIAALNLFNRKISHIKQVIINQHWHDRLLYGSDYPLPGVMPAISSTNLASHGLLDTSVESFLNQVRCHNAWLFDFLQKRFLTADGKYFSDKVFSTRRHFIKETKKTSTMTQDKGEHNA